jgi:hypothetical protein
MIEIDIYIAFNSMRAKKHDTWTVSAIPRIRECIEIEGKIYWVYHIIHNKTGIKIYANKQ